MGIGIGKVVWLPGVNQAYCIGGPHRAPAQGCHCGFNAWHDPQPDYEEGYLQGAIAARGHLEVHYDGFRAEQAKIIALYCPIDAPIDEALSAEQAALSYQVPL